MEFFIDRESVVSRNDKKGTVQVRHGGRTMHLRRRDADNLYVNKQGDTFHVEPPTYD